MPSGRCHKHGGASLKGAAHPAYKHGLRSKYLKALPKQMAAGYRAALGDPGLLSLREEIALLTTRIMQLLDQLKDTPPGPDYDAVWAELRDTILDRSRVTAAELRRLVLLRGVVMVEDALAWARALLEAARAEVDPGQFRRLQEKALALLPAPADDYGPARRPPVVLDNGHAGEPQGVGPREPEAAPPCFTGPAGTQPAPATPPAAPAPPAPGPQCGPKERPPPPDEALSEGESWVWEDEPAGDG
jgi:hypothetical protein